MKLDKVRRIAPHGRRTDHRPCLPPIGALGLVQICLVRSRTGRMTPQADDIVVFDLYRVRLPKRFFFLVLISNRDCADLAPGTSFVLGQDGGQTALTGDLRRAHVQKVAVVKLYWAMRC